MFGRALRRGALGTARREALGARGWRPAADRDAVTKTFGFEDFGAAFGWMARVAVAAEKAGHHPEWLNVYNRVEVTLTTHDTGGLSEKDAALADLMDEFYQ